MPPGEGEPPPTAAAPEEQLRRLRRLHEAALAIAAPMPAGAAATAELLASIVSNAVTALGANAGRLVLAEDSSWEDLVPGTTAADGHVAVRHTGSVARERPRPQDDVLHVLATGTPLFIADASLPSPFGPFPVALARGIRSFAVVPLRGISAVLGTLTVDFTDGGDLSPDARDVLALFAAHAAAALDRTRLSHLERRHAGDRAARAVEAAATRRLSLLAAASALLGSSLDYHITLRNLAQLVVPALADWCMVDVVEPDPAQPEDIEASRISRLAVAAAVSTNASLLEQLQQRYPPDWDSPHPTVRVLRSGEPELNQDVTDEALAAHTRDSEHFRLLRELGVRSYMAVPLIARGHVLGVINFGAAESGRRYGDVDLQLAVEVARHAALAVDNARLYGAEQRARGETEQALRARDEFLSIAAHELKTPMTSLHGMTQLLLRRLAREDVVHPDTLQRALTLINTQASKLTRLTDQLLDVTRTAGGQLALDRQPTNLLSLITNVAQAREASGSPNILLAINGHHRRQAEEIVVYADALRLEQVLINLLENASKHAPLSNDVDIEVFGPEDGMVRITVSDRGPGIPVAHRDRIFDRFYQVNLGSMATGMGLGLYISRQIIQLHGGTIHAEFPDDGGTRMVITLPVS